MKFNIVQIGRPPLAAARQIQAVSENEIAVSFAEPRGVVLELGQVLDIDTQATGADQEVTLPSSGGTMALNIPKRDFHDLRLPSTHRSSRFPSPARMRGG